MTMLYYPKQGHQRIIFLFNSKSVRVSFLFRRIHTQDTLSAIFPVLGGAFLFELPPPL